MGLCLIYIYISSRISDLLGKGAKTAENDLTEGCALQQYVNF